MVKEHIDTTESTIKIDGTVIDGVTPGSLPFPKPSRDTKDVTTMKDTVRKKGLKILDPGSASFSGIAIPGDPGQIALKAASNDLKEHTFTIEIAESGQIFEYQAYVSTDYPSEEDENTLYFNCDLEVTGGFVESTTFASITSIEGAGVGITYSPSTANTALPAAANDVIFKEPTEITTDTVEVTAASASYIGISYDGGKTWTKLTSGTPATISSTIWPAAGGLSKALIMVQEDGKATRFVNLFIARA
jgi:hypothetical protein